MLDYATLLRDRQVLRVRSVDRVFVQGYVPKLQSPGQVCRFLIDKGNRIPSSAVFGKIGRGYVADIERFAADCDIPVVRFKRGERKEAIARPLLDAARDRDPERARVVMVGVAQEKTFAWRSWVAKGQENTPHPHMEWSRQSTFVNHYYFYVWDPDWGPGFIKTNAYAPFGIWIWVNGHEWAKRQCDRAGIAYEAMADSNGFAACGDPEGLQRICDRLGSQMLHSFLWRWLAILPSPFDADDLGRGYVYDLAFRQFEVSDTIVFDRPIAGRQFFEGVIRDHLDMGRPDNVSLTFDRKILTRGRNITPGRFRTRVVTRGVDPQIWCTYKSSKIKQYFKDGRALRTETTINDTRDFAIGRRVTHDNWNALWAVGDNANQRLCDAQSVDTAPAPDVATINEVTQPSTTPEGQPAPSLRFGDPRAMALLAAICRHSYTIAGFTNADLVTTMCSLTDDATYHSRKATYDLRRLKRKQLIARIDGTNRYQPTPHGRAIATLFCRAHQRALAGAAAWLDPDLPDTITGRHPLAQAHHNYNNELDTYITQQLTAA